MSEATFRTDPLIRWLYMDHQFIQALHPSAPGGKLGTNAARKEFSAAPHNALAQDRAPLKGN